MNAEEARKIKNDVDKQKINNLYDKLDKAIVEQAKAGKNKVKCYIGEFFGNDTPRLFKSVKKYYKSNGYNVRTTKTENDFGYDGYYICLEISW